MPTTLVADDEGETWVSAGIAAGVLHVTAQTVRRYALSGKIPHFRTPSGHIRLRLSDLQAIHQRLADPQVETFEKRWVPPKILIGGSRRLPARRTWTDTSGRRLRMGDECPPWSGN
jgi:hypothetical protein